MSNLKTIKKEEQVMRIKLGIMIIMLMGLFFIFGCSVEPSKVAKSEATKMAKKLTYFQDKRTGLCFAVIATRKTAQTSQSGMGMSAVPCEEVMHLVVNKD